MEAPESSVADKAADMTGSRREGPSIAAQVRESMKAIDAERASRPRVVGADGVVPAVAPRRVVTAQPSTSTGGEGRGPRGGVQRERQAAHEDAFGEGMGVRVLTRASTTRERPPYTKDGRHHFTPTDSERRALRVVMRSLLQRGGDVPKTPAAFVRAAVLRAARVEASPRSHEGAPSVFVPAEIAFHLTPEERAGIEAAMGDRDLYAWIRDAVRTAAGMGLHPWTTCADAVLTKGFRRWGLDALLLALPGRDAGKLYDRAARLGLARDLADERLTLREAEAVSGYSNRTLAEVLADAGVVPLTLTGRYASGKCRRRFVLRSDLERAVKLRGGTEILSEASVRLGRSRYELTTALKHLGHTKPKCTGRWRLPSKVFDEAAALLRRDSLSLKDAAALAGLAVPTMRAWLADAGLIRPGSRRCSFTADVITKVVEARRALPCHRCGLAGHFGDTRRCREAQAAASTETAATETLTEACARTGVHAGAMKRALRDLGHTRPEGAWCWRFPRAVFDAAAVTHRERVKGNAA